MKLSISCHPARPQAAHSMIQNSPAVRVRFIEIVPTGSSASAPSEGRGVQICKTKKKKKKNKTDTGPLHGAATELHPFCSAGFERGGTMEVPERYRPRMVPRPTYTSIGVIENGINNHDLVFIRGTRLCVTGVLSILVLFGLEFRPWLCMMGHYWPSLNSHPRQLGERAWSGLQEKQEKS